MNNDKNTGMSPLSIDWISFPRCTHRQFDSYFKENKKQHHSEIDEVVPESHASLILL